MEDNFEAIFPLEFQVSCICEIVDEETQDVRFYLGSQDGYMHMIDDTTGEVTQVLKLANESDQILKISKLENHQKLFLETKLGFRSIFDLEMKQIIIEVEDRGCIGFSTGIIDDKNEKIFYFSPKIDKEFKVIEFDLVGVKVDVVEYKLPSIKEDIPVLDCSRLRDDNFVFLLENSQLIFLKKNEEENTFFVQKLQLENDDYIGFKVFNDRDKGLRILLQGFHSLIFL